MQGAVWDPEAVEKGMAMRNLKRLALAVLSGTILLQAPGCAETAAVITAAASSVSAGGILYLLRKVID